MELGSQPPLEVWELLRDPILAFYQEGMFSRKKIEGVMTVINNSCKMRKNWYIPVLKASSDQESYTLLEEQHTAFCTWLLGRLFGILGRDSLVDIHPSCVKAQIQVLEVCAENQFMTRFFFNEYVSCLTDLFTFQTSESMLSKGSHLLKRFTPLPIKGLEKLNLTPKYILLQSQSLINNLQKYLVQLLDSMVPNIVLLYEDLMDAYWLVLCKLLQVGTLPLKLDVLKSLAKIISSAGCYKKMALAELCNTLKCVTQSVPNQLLVESDSEIMHNILTSVGDLVNVIVSSECSLNEVSRSKDLLTVLLSVIYFWNGEKQGTCLETMYKNVVMLLDTLPHKTINPENFCFLMNRFETQEFAVKILEKCICDKLRDYVKSTQEYQTSLNLEKTENASPSLKINAVAKLPLWSTLHCQLLEELNSIQSSFPSQPTKQILQEINDIVSKLKSLVECAVKVNTLYAASFEAKKLQTCIVFFPEEVERLISFLYFLIEQLVSIKSTGISVYFSDTIFSSVILTVRYLFLLPEVYLSELACADQAFSILALPWMENNDCCILDTTLALAPKLFTEITSNEMKSKSLHALANIPCSFEVNNWKHSIFCGIIDSMQQSNNTQFVVEVIQSVPVLLLDTTQHPSSILQNILLPTLESRSEIILTAVSEVFASIVCVLSGDVAITSSERHGNILQKSYVCLACCKDFSGSPISTGNILQAANSVVDKFMPLLVCPVIAVRRNMAASLGSLVLHLPSMYKSDTVQTLMKYAEDEDRQVRIIFSRMVKFLIFSRDWIEGKSIESEDLREEHIPLTQVDRVELSHSRPRLELVLQMLFNAINSRLNSKDNADSDVQGTLLSTIVDIGCVPLDCVLLPVLKIVLVCVSHPTFNQPSLGQVYLKRIAVAHNTNVGKLYFRFQSDICQVLINMMGMNLHATRSWTKVMDKVVYSFGFESTTAWLRQSMKCVLPSLLVFVVKFKDVGFFTKIVELLSCTTASLIKEYFQYIYPFAFLNESDEVVEECVKVMEKMSGMSAQDLVIMSFKTLHNQLLLHYDCKPERVEEGICQLIDVLENNTKPHKLDKPPRKEDIAKHLEKRFLGVLVHFDSLLECSGSEESDKIKALQSLPKIIRLMGLKYITPVRFKVLSTLRTALRLTHCDFPHLSCGAWEAFTQSVDIPVLGPILATVVASLLPLLDQFPDEISKIIEWVILRHERELAEHIPDLFFLPNTPTLQNLYQVVQRYVKIKRNTLNDSQKLADYLQQPLRFITHDNVDVRQHGLKYLLSLLKEKQVQFTKSLLQEEVVHEDVAKLLNLLVEGCRDADQNVQLLCVENLGVLGALDPGHLPHKKPGGGLPQIFSVKDDQFAIQALTALAKAYQAARNTRYLDSFAVAIQDFLTRYNISSHPRAGQKNLWDSFPVQIQQVMAPLEDSSYYMTSLQSNLVWPHPVFGTRYASTLSNWAHTWACRLVTIIDNTSAKDLFTLCIPSLKRDINCVLFFLPFILLYAVTSGNEEQHKMMIEEMIYIIQQRSLQEKDIEEKDVSRSNEKFQVRFDRSVILPKATDSDGTTHALCAKTVFTLLDFMEKWVGCSRKKKEEHSENNTPMNVPNVQKFLGQFSKLDLAHGNYGVKEYARALMYLEDYLMEQEEMIKNEEHLSFLERIYAQLNESDGIKGVLAIQCTQPKLLEAVVYHEVAGQHQEALACYELLAKEHTNDDMGLQVQMGMIRCCLSLDQPYAALHIAEGAIFKKAKYSTTFLEAQAECFWRINSFENLEAVLKNPKLQDSTAWGVCIGRGLIDIRDSNKDSLTEKLCSTRNYLSKALSTASLENGNYLQGYPHIIKLHMLQELEEAAKVISMVQSSNTSEECCINAMNNLVQVWDDRLEIVQAASSVQEPLLRLRRCLLQLAFSFARDSRYSLAQLLHQELGTSWLKSAEVARIGKQYQQAYIYLLNAEKYKPKRHFIELAKLHWAKNDQDHALATLRRGLDEHFPKSKEYKNKALDFMVEDRKICAEAKLLVAIYNDESMNVDVEVNVSNYKDAVEVYSQWEKSHACLAQYYDTMSSSRNSGQSGEFQMWAIISYTKSLRYGCNMIYHSMSRMLTLWLDYGKRYHSALQCHGSVPPKEMAEQKNTLDKMNQFIGGHVSVLPSYMFMTGFSQLVSRLCHPVAEVYGVIKTIIVQLLLIFPQQTLWMLVSMSRSSYALRRLRCEQILEDPQVKRSPPLVRLTSDFVKLGCLLTELCHKQVRKEVCKTSVSSIVKNLPKLLATPSFSKIMMPLQHCRTLTLPQKELSSVRDHLPFPLNVPTIVGIRDEVTILQSLQRPRKITLKGSDGKDYDMMCKDKDDLRLDARVMEFNSIINKYLQKDPASRSRGLNIRTYSVVPLNEETGLIEWVPNLEAFRVIISKIYKEMGCFTTNKEIRKYMVDKDARLQVKKDMFTNQLVPRHPPVFRHWFRNSFTDSRSWFEARKSYVHTTAVMSMVGYILGLGDRHGENILLDTTCGDVVHVDFNCLFNRGEKFECPERVPFRLTHNMVSAMGPTGVEGPFRITCEITLHMLREMRETLLSVLQPFVYDPKADDLITRKNIKSSANQHEVTNDSAVQNVNNIDHRLNGIMKQQKCTLQLSVEGQTHLLIQEATSVDNLSQMYIGWGAYI